MLENFKSSVNQLKKVTTLTAAAMLTAVNVVLSFMTVYIAQIVKISFSFITISISGFLYGPFIAGVIGGLSDIIGYIIKPMGPYFPGFTFNAVLTGLIYGFFFYKKPISLKRIFIAKILVLIFINLLFGTLWLTILYGKAFFVILPARALEGIITLPIEAFIMYYAFKFLVKVNLFKQAEL